MWDVRAVHVCLRVLCLLCVHVCLRMCTRTCVRVRACVGACVCVCGNSTLALELRPLWDHGGLEGSPDDSAPTCHMNTGVVGLQSHLLNSLECRRWIYLPWARPGIRPQDLGRSRPWWAAGQKEECVRVHAHDRACTFAYVHVCAYNMHVYTYSMVWYDRVGYGMVWTRIHVHICEQYRSAPAHVHTYPLRM